MSWNADPDSYYFIIAVDEGIPAIQVCPTLSGNLNPVDSVLNMTIFSRSVFFQLIVRDTLSFKKIFFQLVSSAGWTCFCALAGDQRTRR